MCTDFLLQATELLGKTTYVNGRSMEFGTPLPSRVTARAPGGIFRSPAPDQSLGLAWTSKYGYVGIGGADTGLLFDGVNTKGLSTGALWLPGSTYPKPTDDSKALLPEMFVDWALGTCASVDEVCTALKSGAAQVFESPWIAKHAPLHFPLHDATGKSAVVEWVGGVLSISDNPVGVCTNAPPFPVHLATLGQHANLSPVDPPAFRSVGGEYAPSGHGGGLVGLPGDATPMSRFVRAAYLKEFSTKRPLDAQGANTLAFHLLNTVDIPRGVSRASQDDPFPDHTQWVVVKDLTNLVFSTRFYDNMCVYSVDLGKLDWSAIKGKSVDVPTSPTSIDLTGSFGGGTRVGVTEPAQASPRTP